MTLPKAIITFGNNPPRREVSKRDQDLYLKISESFNSKCPRCEMPMYHIKVYSYQPIPILTKNPDATYYEKREKGDYSGVISFSAYMTEDEDSRNMVSCIARLYEDMGGFRTCEHVLNSGARFINGSVAKWSDSDYTSPWFAEYMKQRQIKIDNKKAVDVEVLDGRTKDK
jgi:hypothetical protein